ncbi:MAG: M23 family metallopeptidase, partial [Actinobacteria bacterium]|nr:M23 family metallopeptidase [Actinomycetota bacterium]
TAVLFQNIEPKSVYSSVAGLINRVLDKKSRNTDSTGSNEAAVPANAGLSEDTDSAGGSIDYSGYSQGSNEETVPAAVEQTGQESSIVDDTSGDASIINGEGADNIKSFEGGLFITPANGKLGSPFGERIHPETKAKEFHKGIDIEANNGDPIKASQSGDVLVSGVEKSYGKYIKIRHPDGYVTVYAHCSQLIAKKGQKVKKGDIIAKVGDTGSSTGPHLHFEIWKDGKPQNPLNFIKVSK